MAKKTKKTINVRVEQGTPDWWNQEAARNGYLYGDGGNPGKFLDAIAIGEYVVVKREIWEKIFSKTA
ncbi:MAG: hypothetical protein AB1589_22795 [Cyanobacteriota bacterium]